MEWKNNNTIRLRNTTPEIFSILLRFSEATTLHCSFYLGIIHIQTHICIPLYNHFPESDTFSSNKSYKLRKPLKIIQILSN